MLGRNVVNGERLSGAGNEARGYPEIFVKDGIGPGGGSLMCVIHAFKSADVVVQGGVTRLILEGKTTVTVSSGVVEYNPAGVPVKLSVEAFRDLIDTAKDAVKKK